MGSPFVRGGKYDGRSRKASTNLSLRKEEEFKAISEDIRNQKAAQCDKMRQDQSQTLMFFDSNINKSGEGCPPDAITFSSILKDFFLFEEIAGKTSHTFLFCFK